MLVLFELDDEHLLIMDLGALLSLLARCYLTIAFVSIYCVLIKTQV